MTTRYQKKKQERKILTSVAAWLEILKPPVRPTLYPQLALAHMEITGVADAEKHRPPTPDPSQKDGGIVIQVTLRTLSGRQHAFTTFRMRKDRGDTLGSLITICKPFEDLEGCDYSYFLLLDGKTLNCNENPHHKILEYAGHFRTIPIEEDLDSEYSIDDLVFHLDLQQIVQAAQLIRMPLGCTLQQLSLIHI